ncbi:SAV_2336 N-terminal domain-related protein [Spirillospora sp. NPDC048911]|uniref:SAV_2336 N-terminal domain-related protein n=1 Tax=Spirillospora sp. NPDC048911 TaxID=3364527 RepID=UPI003717708D
MRINELRQALDSLGQSADARELSEILWLACHTSEGPAASAPEASPAPDTAHNDLPALEEIPERPAAPKGPHPTPTSALHPRPAAPEIGGDATEILVPTAPMLADPLSVQRALRPLKRRVASPLRTELDEDATAARIADTALWVPVLTPAPERWLSLNLVVDTGPSMRLWRPLARELAETIRRQGAFRDVHLTYLDVSGGVSSSPTAPALSPTALLDPAGRHATLVLSDCSGPHWWNGRAPRALHRWAQTGPAAILQPLPERLWRRTAAPTTPGLASLPRPGAPNTKLHFTPYDGETPEGLPIPVLEIAPRWLSGWANLVAGAGPRPTAVATPTATTAAPVRRERELPPEERVRRFLVTASPEAAELAAHVAVSFPSLPVMRLVQKRILGESGPSQLAEVLLSGLLRPLDVALGQYEFVPGAREALLASLPRPEAWHTRHVLEHVSAEIERRAGSSTEMFRALLPATDGDQALPCRPFALLNPEARALLDRTTTPPPPSPLAARNPDLLELLGRPVSQLIIDARWRAAGETVPVPIGVADEGEPVRLDLLGGYRVGPHGLIIGAPGSGRIALLRTIVTGLALTYPPRTVAFVLADLGAGNAFDGLAGTSELITATAFQPSETTRLVTALTDELDRREAFLTRANTRSWAGYQGLLAREVTDDPLPASFVVIDEFGAALTQTPGFARVLERVAKQGERLGVRLVLASTERQPTFTERLTWRIALRDEPGTGHLYVGDATPTHFHTAEVPSDVASLFRTSPPVLDWTRPLDEWAPIPLGMSDEGPVRLDVMDGFVPGHGLITDPQESGRSGLVRSLVTQLARVHPPTQLNFLLADYSGGTTFTDGLDRLPHVADVVVNIAGELSLADRLGEALIHELDRRRSFLEVSRSSAWHHYQSSVAQGEPIQPLPALFVLVNMVDELLEVKPDFGEVIRQVVERGPLLGVQLTLISTGRKLSFGHDPSWFIAASGESGRLYQPREPTAFKLLPEHNMPALIRLISDHGPQAHWLMPRRRPGAAAVDDALDATGDLIQLSSVRAQLKSLAERELERLHGNEPARHLHLAFTGPGQFARRPAAKGYASVLAELGVLRKAQIIESTWAGLTYQEVSQAYGGLLYIADDGRSPGSDAEAAALMERLRPEAVIVFEGETERIASFMREHPDIAAKFDATVTFFEEA